jgi:hypothetical protein
MCSNLASIISELNSKQEEFRRKLNDIEHFMHSYRIPDEMRDRVRSCVQYIYGAYSVNLSFFFSALFHVSLWRDNFRLRASLHASCLENECLGRQTAPRPM